MKSFLEHGFIPSISLKEARKILGTTSEKMTDVDVQKLIANMEILTDAVIRCANDSKFQPSIEYYKHKVDTDA